MTSKEKAEFMIDAQTIDGVMRKYSDESGGHFGFICYGDMRQMFLGGRVDIVGVRIAEAMAMIVDKTQGLTSEFIDAVCITAKEIYAGIGGEKKVQ